MSQQLLVITGVSGFVGFRVLAEALGKGYRVRAVIRKAAQSELIKSAESVKPHLDKLEFVVVPDLLARGAFDGILVGADGIKNIRRDMIDPAINATLRVLESAKNVPTIKRIVITASIGTILKWDWISSNDRTRVFTASDTYTPTNLDGPFANVVDAYFTSKAAALAATERFIQEEKPHYDVVNIQPSIVTGRHELALTPDDLLKITNVVTLTQVLDTKDDTLSFGNSVHIDDVARVHIDALNPSVPGNRNYLCASGGEAGTDYRDAKNIVRRHFSKAVEDGTLPLTGSQPVRPVRFDASETEKVFGFKFASYEEQVKSIVGQYLSLVAAK
ncbi:hypothetical protein DHEL01_v210358 [Diaporthe helianthi]|uniref:NAD-dependent epimerase/dehydratase domain-containing protein n=1 Tax=Diaporthe helianthi TaxID=158607 RepID=A0A2P5HLZ2_DIAHE|nr:hypothetical protein DHEL01_v210358 [Diaporthe helianthi]